jgi:methylmalonyl-CoA mutase
MVPRVRYAEEFEVLRDRADAAAQRPKVFLATLGPVGQHSARAGFAANLLAAGGIESVPGPVEEFAAADTTVACLCSSDNVYADQAEPAVEALRAAGAKQVWLAGKKAVGGVDGTLFAGCDALHVLRSVHDALGVPA